MLRVLHSVAQHGRACVFSIHQCPASLFGTFSRVLVISRQGRQLYFGPPAEIPAYLARFALLWLQACITIADCV